jgi:hypothetical protein
MAIVTLNLSPRHAHLKVAASSYASAETRLDLRCSLDHWSQIVDPHGESLTDMGWSLWIFDGASSVHAESVGHGVGSIRYRPRSPNGLAGDCVVQADLPSPGFASLLAVCVTGTLPEFFSVTVDGLEDDGTETFVWDREANSFLTVTSISTGADLRVKEAPAENDA